MTPSSPVAPSQKRLIIEMIQMWAALESMAARLAAQHASDEELATLRRLVERVQSPAPDEHRVECPDAHLAFHAAVTALGGCQAIIDATRGLLPRISAIRRATTKGRSDRSIAEYLKIIEALERRDAEIAERLTRQHALDLAQRVERYWERLGYSQPAVRDFTRRPLLR